jgi:polar amino acid transport system substrate-binding protein
MRPLVMTRKSRLVWAIASLAVLAAVSSSGAATLEEIRARGFLVVVTQDDMPPFEYATARGVIGYDNELLIGLREATGLKIHHEVTSLCGVVAGIASGQYDVAVTALVARPGAGSVIFTAPVAETSVAYLARQDNASIQQAEDLRGRTVGVQKCSGLAAEASVQVGGQGSTGAGSVVQFDSLANAYQEVVAGRIDAVIGTSASLGLMARETSGLFRMGSFTKKNVQIVWGVRKGNEALVELLNTYIVHLRTTGELARLQYKYDLLGSGT